MSEKVVNMSHVRSAGFCVSGLRQVCMAHGIDLRRLATTGVPISELEGIDDANVRIAVEIAKKDTE